MYVCICHSVTDKAIKKAVKQGHETLEAIQWARVAGGAKCKVHSHDVWSLENDGYQTSPSQFRRIDAWL